MLVIELVRRWGLLVLGVALLVVGIVLIAQDPTGSGSGTQGYGGYGYGSDDGGALAMSGQGRLLLGWGMAIVGLVLSAIWTVLTVRRRRGSHPAQE